MPNCHATIAALVVGLLGAEASVAWAAPESGGRQVDDAAPVIGPQLLGEVRLDYPDEALELGLHADVVVRVAIDQQGRVVDVTVLEGPEIFEPEARRAARALRFAPATRGDQPIPSTATVTFHFAAPELHELLVVGRDDDMRETRSVTTLDTEELDRLAGQDTAEVVSQVAGVEVSRGNGGVSKPIIRGQAERRILILQDGVRHESQKWGPDHAPEVDPFAAGSIRVVKGAAAARYGPDAIGGVLLVDPPPLRDTPGVEGRALLTGSLNGPAAYAAARVDVVPAGAERLSLRVEGNVRRAASPRTPEYVLGNTALSTWNAGAALRYGDDDTHARLTFRHYDLVAGIFFGVRASAEEFGVAPSPEQVERWSENRFVRARPRQVVTHDRATLHLRRTLPAGHRLEAVYAFQLNRRREFEAVQFAFEGPEFDFLLYTNSLDLVATHAPALVGGARLTGGVGAQGFTQLNIYRGSTLLPNYRAFQGSLFAFERLEPSPTLALQVGGRVDALSRTAMLLGPDVARQEAEGGLDDETIANDCREGEFRLLCPTGWTTASGSLGGVWQGADDRLALKLDLSSASRFPSVDEQYLIGTAPTFPVWAIGDLSLGPETTWQVQSTVAVRLAAVEGELSGYASRSPNYVYFSPDRDNPLRTTIVGVVPQWRFQQIRSAFLGADGTVTLGPRSPIGLRLTGSVVRATDLDTGEFLVNIPPNRGTATLLVRPPGRLQPKLTVTIEGVARQTGPPLDADLLPPPDGYALLSASAGITIPVGSRELLAALDGFNLLDVRYREYVSLLRYYADFPGRDLRLRLGFRF